MPWVARVKRVPQSTSELNLSRSPAASCFFMPPLMWEYHDADTSQTPGSTLAAAIRRSKATARGTQ